MGNERRNRASKREAHKRGYEAENGRPAAPPPPPPQYCTCSGHPTTLSPPHRSAPTQCPGPESGPGPSPARSARPPARAVGEGVPEPSSSRSQVPDTSASPPPATFPATHAAGRAGVAALARSVGTFMKVSTAPLAVSR